MTQEMTMKNISPLPVTFYLRIQDPKDQPGSFKASRDVVTLLPNESCEVVLSFDPNRKDRNDRNCQKVNGKLKIEYDDHPHKDFVDLNGEVNFPNLDLDEKVLDFGAILNETSKQLTLTMTNNEVLAVNYKWAFVDLNDDAGNKSVSIRGVDVAINQVFDILPIQGRLEPGESQTVTVTYQGVTDRNDKSSETKSEATAVCMVEGGPEYEVNLLGESAPLKFDLSDRDLDFGDILYDQIGEKEVYISNPGRVAGYYAFNLAQIARPTTTDAYPLAGIIHPAKAPNDRQKVVVRFRTGIPDSVQETIMVEMAHRCPGIFARKQNG
jgi:hydrocephalus-inducing protein